MNKLRRNILETRLYRLIENANSIAIFSHVTPDADALCSSFALKNIINNNFDLKSVDVFVDGEIGELYKPILRNEVINPQPLENYDLAFVLDCPNLQRIGKYIEMAQNIPNVINIDHHNTNSKFGTLNYIANFVSSTCEIIYLIAKGQNFEINNEIAKELYQGIITDTNCFTSMTMTPRTQSVVSELTKYKFDANKIENHYFKHNSTIKSNLFRIAIQSMNFLDNGNFVTMKISFDDINKVGATFEDTLGIIDNIMNIISSNVGTIIIEKAPNYSHCSLRSKNQLNVGEIATMFDGGGNEKQAAFQKYGKMEEIEEILIQTILPRLPKTELANYYDEFEYFN